MGIFKDIYYNENCLTRTVLFEKYKPVTLLGFKGHSYMEPGYVFAPYIPLMTEPVHVELYQKILDASNIISRYAEKNINNSFYGNVIICSPEVARTIDDITEELI